MKNQRILKNPYTQNKEILYSTPKLLLIRSKVALRNNFKTYKFFNNIYFTRFIAFYINKNNILKKRINISPVKQNNFYFFKENTNHCFKKTKLKIQTYVNYCEQNPFEEVENKPLILKNRAIGFHDVSAGVRIEKYNTLLTNSFKINLFSLKLFLNVKKF